MRKVNEIISTKEFIQRLIDGQIKQEDTVHILAKELLALMQENIELYKEKETVALNSDLEINRLKKHLAEKAEVSARFRNLYEQSREYELQQRRRANKAEQELETIKSAWKSRPTTDFRVEYSRGDLLDFHE